MSYQKIFITIQTLLEMLETRNSLPEICFQNVMGYSICEMFWENKRTIKNAIVGVDPNILIDIVQFDRRFRETFARTFVASLEDSPPGDYLEYQTKVEPLDITKFLTESFPPEEEPSMEVQREDEPLEITRFSVESLPADCFELYVESENIFSETLPDDYFETPMQQDWPETIQV